ncbi:HAD-IA family hydrolase [Rugosimonospora acidiphila]
MRLNCQAILVDIDGTLVDSAGAVTRAWSLWSKEYGVDVDAVLRVCQGRRSEDTVAEFLPQGQREEALRRLDALELADLAEVVALPGAHPLLESLPSGRWAAVTSGNRALMGARLAAAGLPVPEVVVAADDVSAGKPSPEGYLKAAAALGYDIDRCVVVEDSRAGVAAGRAAGAWVVAVATTHPAAQLGVADIVVPDLTALTVDVIAGGLLLRIAS